MENVVIVGSGCAGLTAAIYTARADLKPVVVEGAMFGGQLALTTDVENYPGFPEGIQGPDLMAAMKKQAQRFGTRFISGDVSEIDLKKRPFKLAAGDQKLETRSLILATGASAKFLGLESEKALLGHGLSACATCDAFFFKGKAVVVIGGGDTAMEEATFLTKFASKVTVVHRRAELRASKIMQQKARDNQKIAWALENEVIEVLDPSARKVTGVKLKSAKDGKVSELKCDGVFVAIGHQPNTGFLKGQVALDEKGYLKLAERTLTSVPGVFGCGDVHDVRYKQAVTAAGSGCMAALDCERFLESEGG